MSGSGAPRDDVALENAVIKPRMAAAFEPVRCTVEFGCPVMYVVYMCTERQSRCSLVPRMNAPIRPSK